MKKFFIIYYYFLLIYEMFEHWELFEVQYFDFFKLFISGGEFNNVFYWLVGFV